MTTHTRAKEWLVDSETYHADTTAVSNSALKVFIDDGPGTYQRRFVTQVEPRPEPTIEINRGSWLHCAALEPERWASEYRAMPYFGDGRTTKAKEAQRAWLADNADKVAVDAESYRLVNLWREALFANRIIRQLLEAEGQVEHSVRHPCPHSGLMLKSRRDKVLDHYNDEDTLILDIKTTQSAKVGAFMGALWNFGYYRQASFYCDLHELAFSDCPRFVFLVVAKQTLECATYVPPPKWLILGQMENRKALTELAACHASGVWQAEHETKVITLPDPKPWHYENLGGIE